MLFGGFGLGVGVMIVLLSIGEAMLAQSKEEKLVGGGTITVLPEGIDVEVMKTGGVGGLFLSIPNARFIARQLLASPRLAGDVAASAPQIDGKLLYVKALASGRDWIAVRASGEIPSLTAAVGAMPLVSRGAWLNDASDESWRSPDLRRLYTDIDAFHYPPSSLSAEEKKTWGEWHYFNVLSSDKKRWAFLTLLVGGDVPSGEWGGQVLLTLHEQGGSARKFTMNVPKSGVSLDSGRVDLAIGASSVKLQDDGRYLVHAIATENRDGAKATVDLVVTPVKNAYFPGAQLGGEGFVSGYAVAGLRANAAGTICVSGKCETFDAAQSYHDHNWGVWRDVEWEWGASRAGDFTLLYGRVQRTDSLAAEQPLFLYLVDSLGFRALFRPKTISYDDARTVVVNGKSIHVPAKATMIDIRGVDTLRVALDIEDASATDTRAAASGGGSGPIRPKDRPYFIQMKGTAAVSGRLGGKPISGSGSGFFETYR